MLYSDQAFQGLTGLPSTLKQDEKHRANCTLFTRGPDESAAQFLIHRGTTTVFTVAQAVSRTYSEQVFYLLHWGPMDEQFRRERDDRARHRRKGRSIYQEASTRFGSQVRTRAKATYPDPLYLRRTSSVSQPWRALHGTGRSQPIVWTNDRPARAHCPPSPAANRVFRS
jgi:hypothetical protein